jgi:TM2 domain-containing membrane protein YozV
MRFSAFILIGLFYVNISFSQSYLEEQYDYAKNLLEKEEYFDAVTELKRLIYFDTTGSYKYEAYIMMGTAYKEGGKYSEAVEAFINAEINSGSTDKLFSAKVEKIKTNILRRAINSADNQLREMESEKSFSNRADEIQYWRGWLFIFNDEWNKASEVFSSVDSAKSLSNFCSEVDKQKYSVTFAKTISYFIPGAGQFYTGNYISGAMSLAYNLLAGYFTVNSFVEDRVFDGVVTANFLWLRFYNGNIQNAENFAVKKNLEITNLALEYLQNNYEGSKP